MRPHPRGKAPIGQSKLRSRVQRCDKVNVEYVICSIYSGAMAHLNPHEALDEETAVVKVRLRLSRERKRRSHLLPFQSA